MINFLIWILGLIFLLCFSYLDYTTKEVENDYILIFFICSMLLLVLIERSVIVGSLMLITGILGVYMWKLKIIGGADVKILPSMIPFMLIGSANYYMGYINFLIIFGCVGVSYALIYKNFISKKRTKYIPFVPALAITYFLFSFLYLI